MRIIVITPENYLEKEVQILKQIIENGVERIHIRKPGSTAKELERFLNQFSAEERTFFSLNQHHHLAEKYQIRYLHVKSGERGEAPYEPWRRLKNKGYLLSSSAHSLKEAVQLDGLFEYVFISPVFDSISKPDYPGILQELQPEEIGKSPVKLVALGGLNELNINKLNDYNFDMIALLGILWQNPEKALDRYLLIQSLCKNTVPIQ